MELEPTKSPIEFRSDTDSSTYRPTDWASALRGVNPDVFGIRNRANNQDDVPPPPEESSGDATPSEDPAPPSSGDANVNDPPKPPTPPTSGAESPGDNEDDFKFWNSQIDNKTPYLTVNEGEALVVSEDITPITKEQLNEIDNHIEIEPGAPLIASRGAEIASSATPGDYNILASSGDTVAAFNLRDSDINPDTTGQDLEAVSNMLKSIKNFGPGTEIFIAAPSDPNAEAPQKAPSGGTIELEWSRLRDPNSVGSNLEHIKHVLGRHFSEDKITVVGQGEAQEVSTSPDGITHIVAHSRESNVSRIISHQHGGSTDERPFKLQIPRESLDNWFITESSNAAAEDWIGANGTDRVANPNPTVEHMLDNNDFVRPDLVSVLHINNESYPAYAIVDRVTGVMDVTSLPEKFNPRATAGLNPGANLVERLVHVARDLGCKQVTIPTTKVKFLDTMAMRRLQKLPVHIKLPTTAELTDTYDANAKRFGFNKMDPNQEKHRKDL